MGLIREPEGVDFIIKSQPLTKKEQELLSEFIREYKAKKIEKYKDKKQASKKRRPVKKKITT